MIVAKFGGTSVENAEAIRRAAEIVRGRIHRRPLVVVSALGGATNALIGVAEMGAKGYLIGALRAVESLRERHLHETRVLIGGAEAADELAADVSAMFDELASLAEALSVLGHLTPRSLDAIAAYGEHLSSRLVSAAFRETGIDAVEIAATDVMITDDAFTRAAPRVDLIERRAREHVAPVLAAGRVPVVGGFVGATEQGVVTTLGRGGSDYSAALFGAALHAEAIEIWTDVDGMLTADPRVVPDARLITEIRFDEASELASYGAKVLHPSTVAPAVEQNIPVYVFNSRRPEGRGTRIMFDAPRRVVTAIAGKPDVTAVEIRSPRMLLEHGVLRDVFDVFDRHRTSIDVVATSEVSVSLTVDDASHLDALLVDLRRFGDVSVERNRALVALVGAGLGEHTDAIARALAALGSTRVHMLSLSATGINLTLLVDGDRLGSVVAALHQAFFSSPGT